jgi:hypothetical protein
MLMRFNLVEKLQTVEDPNYSEVSNLDEAKRIATEAARGILAAQMIETGLLDFTPRIDVMGEAGHLLTVRFSSVVEIFAG